MNLAMGNDQKNRLSHNLRSAAGVVLLLLGMSLLSMRLIHAAKENYLTLQIQRHAFDRNIALPLPASITPGFDRARILFAQVALADGDTQLALDLVEPLANRHEPDVLLVQARAMEQQGNFAGAVEPITRLQNAVWLIKVGREAALANDIAGALAAYRAAWAIDPEHGTSPLVGYLMINLSDPVAAEVVLRETLSAYPESNQRLSLYIGLGDDLRMQKRFSEAEVVYRDALIENPNDWQVHIGIGWLKYERGDGLTAALDEFQKAIDNPQSLANGQLAIAQMLTREKKYKEADPWYGQALAISPTEDVFWERGRNAQLIPDLSLALAVYQESLAHFPDTPYAYLQLAHIYQMNNQPSRAVAAIEQALRLKSPPDSWYYTTAGSIYETAGDPSRALQAYRQALSIDPQNTDALDAVKRLEK